MELQADFLDALRDLSRWLAYHPRRAVVIGGVAAVFLGRPRVTHDLDALVWWDDEDVPDFAAQGANFGFEPRLSDAVAFALEHRVLLLRHEPTSIEVDLALGMLPFEEQVIQNAQILQIREFELPFPTPENLLVMKFLAGRPRDIADIEGILAKWPRLDRQTVRAVVAQLAADLEAPEILENLDRLFR